MESAPASMIFCILQRQEAGNIDASVWWWKLIGQNTNKTTTMLWRGNFWTSWAAVSLFLSLANQNCQINILLSNRVSRFVSHPPYRPKYWLIESLWLKSRFEREDMTVPTWVRWALSAHTVDRAQQVTWLTWIPWYDKKCELMCDSRLSTTMGKWCLKGRGSMASFRGIIGQ